MKPEVGSLSRPVLAARPGSPSGGGGAGTVATSHGPAPQTEDPVAAALQPGPHALAANYKPAPPAEDPDDAALQPGPRTLALHLPCR